jgi:hypothetical protein
MNHTASCWWISARNTDKHSFRKRFDTFNICTYIVSEWPFLVNRLIRDVMSLFPQVDRILAQLIVDLHIRSEREHGEDYDPIEVAENLISVYKQEHNETDPQHLPVDQKQDELV